MEKYIAIGDIHGCTQQLNEILEKCKNFPDHQLIFLGDYIDRGTDSNGVIDIIRSLNAICLMGNHEEMLIDYMDAIKNESISFDMLEHKKISLENFNWMKSTLLYFYETSDYFFSHAGLNPRKPLSQQTHSDYLWSYYEESLIHLTNKIVVQGHLRNEKVRTVDNHVLIDTGCGMGGYLSAYMLPEKVLIQSDTRS